MSDEFDKRLDNLEAEMKILKAERDTSYERLRGDIARGQVAMIVAMAVIVGLGLAIHGWVVTGG